MTTEQFERLPKYAQMEITRLRNNVEYLKDRVTAGPDDSDTFANPFIDPTPLGQGTLVRFLHVPGDEEDHRAYFEARMETDYHGGRYLSLRSDDTLQLEPQATNVVRVRRVRL